jgi:glucose-specific phosphotransferase system IIA component
MFFKKKSSDVVAVCDGIINDLSAYPDEAIAMKALGDGYMIEPTDGKIVAPISGNIVMIFPTGHAIGIQNNEYETLIHIGVDTVKLEGKGFVNEVKVGDKVDAGQLICSFDFNQVRKHPDVLAVTTAVIFTGSNKKVKVLTPKASVRAGQENIIKVI